MKDALEAAREAIDSGAAYRKLINFIEATGGDPSVARRLTP
jgi:thymidine phosphorylase